MNEYDEIIISLKDRIFNLITKYEQIKNEYNDRVQECDNLKKNISEKETIIKVLENKYNTLKVAKTIEFGKGDTRETKLRINKIVREIDECIALLNV